MSDSLPRSVSVKINFSLKSQIVFIPDLVFVFSKISKNGGRKISFLFSYNTSVIIQRPSLMQKEQRFASFLCCHFQTNIQSKSDGSVASLDPDIETTFFNRPLDWVPHPSARGRKYILFLERCVSPQHLVNG